MKIEYSILELKTKHDFNIARAAAPAVRRNVWVRGIDYEYDFEGWGEAAPNAYYNESAETVIAAIEAKDEEQAGGSGRAALSAAWLDFRGKVQGKTVAELLNVPRGGEQYSSFTIGIDRLDVMREKVREARSYRILKIKVGTPEDERILEMLREERPDAIIRVDANTGWSLTEAKAKLPMLEAYNIELIEQPLPPDDYDGLAQLTAISRIPIIADESCKRLSDLSNLIGRVHGVNIKLAKCGFLQEAVEIANTAREHGMLVMIGCMIESTLGIAAAMQIAPLADYVDLDGAALLENDPFVGPGIEADGRLRFSDLPGLGVRLASEGKLRV